jgi:hypothetical protein
VAGPFFFLRKDLNVSTEVQRADLVKLAEEINQAHQECGGHFKATVQHAVIVGQKLIEAKRKLKHGEWLKWVEEHCEFHVSSAKRYMTHARNRSKLGDLPPTEALKLPKPKRPKEPKTSLDAALEILKSGKSFVGRLRRLADDDNLLECVDADVGFLLAGLDFEIHTILTEIAAKADATLPTNPEQLKVGAQVGYDPRKIAHITEGEYAVVE